MRSKAVLTDPRYLCFTDMFFIKATLHHVPAHQTLSQTLRDNKGCVLVWGEALLYYCHCVHEMVVKIDTGRSVQGKIGPEALITATSLWPGETVQTKGTLFSRQTNPDQTHQIFLQLVSIFLLA